MKLLMSPASPFVRKVRVMIHEANLNDTVTEVEVTTNAFASDPAVIAANPAGKIPTLIRSDGPALCDSRVITRFLDHHASAGLYPDTRIWEVLTLESLADAIMDAAVSMTYEVRLRPEEKQFDDWIDAQWDKIARTVGTINDRWVSHLSGPIDMSHIAVGCALGYLDLRHDARDWRRDNATLAAWFAGFSARDSMIATKA